MNSKAYILGFLCGLALVVIIGLLLRYVFKKKCLMGSGEYDERQKAIQGTGYKYAYLTMMIVMVLGSMAEVMTGFSWNTLFPFTMLGMWISLCVFIGYCVIKDAYFSLRSKRKVFILIFLIAGAFNLFIARQNICGGERIISDGRLNYIFVNLLTGVCVLLLAGIMIAKSIAERRQEENE